MKWNWTEEDLFANWLILPEERQIIENKRGATRLGFAILLKFFQLEGHFPSGPHEIPTEAVKFVAQQVGVDSSAWQDYRWQARSAEYHRAHIRKYLGFQESTVSDAEAMRAWLINDILSYEYRMERLREIILDRYRTLRIEPPTQGRIRRLLRSAFQEHETRFCNDIFQSLDSDTLDRLDSLLGE